MAEKVNNQFENYRGSLKESVRESAEMPQTAPEQMAETAEKTLADLTNKSPETDNFTVNQAGGRSGTASLNVASSLPHYREIESILESGLKETYGLMPPLKQQEFKKQGEQTVRKISQLLSDVKIKLSRLSKQVFNLIALWLKIIPGVNRFFLEQEAKIKADQILALKNKKP